MLLMQAAMSAQMAEMMKETPMYKSYIAVAPDSNEFPKLMDRMGELMRKPYDWTEDLKKLKMRAGSVRIYRKIAWRYCLT
jgi:hypothetical protein